MDKIEILREHIKKEIRSFQVEDLLPSKQDNIEAAVVLSSWAIPAVLFVLWANSYYPEVEYYQKAIREGFGPNLWNAIACFGLMAFGVAISFSTFRMPARFAKKILMSAYAIGCLTFGLLVGQWFLLPLDQLVWWQRGLFGITSVFLLVVVLMYNVVLWYLGSLLYTESGDKTRFLKKVEMKSGEWRLFAGVVIFLLSVAVFLNA